MMIEDPAALRYWLGLMSAWKGWFRYTVEGMEHLDGPGCKMVVGYHGRPLAYDLFLLGAEIHDRHGYLPLALVHRAFLNDPYLRWLTEGLDWAVGRGPAMEDAVQQGRHMILAPGGPREGLRPAWIRNRVDWGDHCGYLRFAVRHDVPVVPAAASGVDLAYLGLHDGRTLMRRLGTEWPTWIGLGPLGFYPWSPPFPVKIHQIVGAPIRPRDEGVTDPRDAAGVAALHRRITDRVQELQDEARRLVRVDAPAQRLPRRPSLRRLLDRVAERMVG